MTKKTVKLRNGSINGHSRYSKLKEELDESIFNRNWSVLDTLCVSKNYKYNFVDLFSGAGGISLGFKKANYNKVMSLEIDPDASETIRKNFPESTHIQAEIESVTDEDILKIIGDQQIHVVAGGPPCNGFSVAGRRNPDDPRNQLFNQFLRVVRLLRPWVVMMENVPGILTMSKGTVKDEIISLFSSSGYDNMAVRILEAANFGVPQLRTRAIFVGNRFGKTNLYPKEILKREEYIPIEFAIKDLAAMDREPEINHEWTKHSEQFEERISKVPPGGSLYESYRDAFKRQHLGVPSMAIKENHGGTHIHPTLNRVISAREMARLQTFPDDFIFSGTMKRAMWQIGNAVPVLMAEHIAIALRPLLDQIKNKI